MSVHTDADHCRRSKDTIQRHIAYKMQPVTDPGAHPISFEHPVIAERIPKE
jgi:hypothetical protein